MKIAIFGAHINSTNLGCQALTYSLLHLLDKISKNHKENYEYYIFEKKNKMCEQLNIDCKNVYVFKESPIYRWRSYVKHGKDNIKMLRLVKSCDVAIDLTAGDSFSDIYGSQRFNSRTRIKRIIQKLGIPLMLGPQTYGPFENKKNEQYARKVFINSNMCIARDKISAELVKSLTGNEIEYTTDLAFQLPYQKMYSDSQEKRVGINVSALLVNDSVEIGFDANNKLSVDYDKLITQLMDYFEDKQEYSVYLISHVSEDYVPCKKIAEKYTNVNLVPIFDDPISIKSFISSLDLFIGSRMHATVASFTSGVPTIPLAYSRKFEGLFDVVGYKYVVDLQTLNTHEAFDIITEYISNLDIVKEDLLKALENSNEYGKKTEKYFERFIYNNLV